MSQAPIPAGHHDADSAAKLLGVTKRYLLQYMRELGWLHVGGDHHNMPRHELKHAGWLATHDRAHCLKGKKEIVKTYRVMLLSQTGFQELKKIMHTKKEALAPVTNIAPQVIAIKIEQPKKEIIAEKPYDKTASEIERQTYLQQMADWGFPIAAGRN
jgi:hypothetical protein